MNYVLGGTSHIMVLLAYLILAPLTNMGQCKHILATLLARKLSACSKQPITAEELASLLQRHFISTEPPKGDTTDNPFL